VLLAATAGRSAGSTGATVAVGAALEALAREQYRQSARAAA
jgi:hypothetical protein